MKANKQKYTHGGGNVETQFYYRTESGKMKTFDQYDEAYKSAISDGIEKFYDNKFGDYFVNTNINWNKTKLSPSGSYVMPPDSGQEMFSENSVHNKIKKLLRESSRQAVVNKVTNAKIGTVLPESDIYVYVQQLHHTPDDFYDGNLGERIEQYDNYQLTWLPIAELDLDEFYWDEDEVDEWITKYGDSILNHSYPPIIYDRRNGTIIDGTHRSNMVDKMGLDRIKAWVGQ